MTFHVKLSIVKYLSMQKLENQKLMKPTIYTHSFAGIKRERITHLWRFQKPFPLSVMKKSSPVKLKIK